MTKLKEQLMGECYSAGIDERTEFFSELIDIILEQQRALENANTALGEASKLIRHLDHNFLENTKAWDMRQDCSEVVSKCWRAYEMGTMPALAATNEKLKALGCEI